MKPERDPDTPPILHADRIGVPVADSETAVAYLKRRGIPEHLATEAGLRFTHMREGQPAVLFPMRNENGSYIAAHARSIVDDRKKTRGPKKVCVFATPAAFNAHVLAVTEAPIDALSLALAGLPTIALIGTIAPPWLRRHVFSRRVLIATDADDAGEAAALTIGKELTAFGAQVHRLRPPDECKDWNDALVTLGYLAVRSFLESHDVEFIHPMAGHDIWDEYDPDDYQLSIDRVRRGESVRL